MKKINISLVIVFLFVFLFSYGQELTLDQCIKMALEQNKNVSIAKKQYEKSDLQLKAAGTNFLPKISADGMGLYGDSKFYYGLSVPGLPEIGLNFEADKIYSAGVGFRQPVYMGGKISSAYKMAKIGKDISGLNQKLTGDNVIVNVNKAYWSNVEAVEMLGAARKYRETVAELYRTVKNAYDTGLKQQNDVLKVKVKLNKADLQLQRAKNGVRIAKMNLCDLIGLPLDSNIEPTETFESIPLDIDNNAGITGRPEYSILDKQVDLKKYEKRYVLSSFLPQIGINGSYHYVHGLKLNDEYLLNGNNYSFILSVKIPLFYWGEGYRKVKAAERDRDIMKLKRDDMYRKMTLELQHKLDTYNESLLEVKMTCNALKQSEENLRMSKNHYNAGLETLSDYLEAQAIWQNSQAEYISARTNLEISKIEYLRASGNL